MPRLFHFSDTHLGHQQYARTDADGQNQREQDIYAAFHRVVDLAVAERPDLVVHAGDLFDGVRPGNRALAHAMEGFLKLSRAGIPTVAIAGNHEQPKLRETGSPFRIFEHLPHVRMVYRGQRETLEVPTPEGPIRIHAVPQPPSAEALALEVASAPLGSDGKRPHDRPAPEPAADGWDVLAVHGAVSTLRAFSHAEFNELTLDASWFRPFHYVALGHYHGVQEVAPAAWYCGAPERMSLAEADQAKGFLDVELGAGTPVARFRPVPGRPYVDLPALEARGMTASDVLARAKLLLSGTPPGAVVRLRATRLDATLRGSLDQRAIRQAGAHLLNLDLRLEWDDQGLAAVSQGEMRGLWTEFEAFLATQPLAGLDREAVVAEARRLLEPSP